MDKDEDGNTLWTWNEDRLQCGEYEIRERRYKNFSRFSVWSDNNKLGTYNTVKEAVERVESFQASVESLAKI